MLLLLSTVGNLVVHTRLKLHHFQIHLCPHHLQFLPSSSPWPFTIVMSTQVGDVVESAAASAASSEYLGTEAASSVGAKTTETTPLPWTWLEILRIVVMALCISVNVYLGLLAKTSVPVREKERESSSSDVDGRSEGGGEGTDQAESNYKNDNKTANTCASSSSSSTAAAAAAAPSPPPVLIVIAHPDDEAMFFGPSILSLSRDYTVHLLCLSTGNYRQEGTIRQRELVASCELLGIPRDCVHVVHDEVELPDHPTRMWTPQAVAARIIETQRAVGADKIVTFDEHGVSGHINHRAILPGVLHAQANGALMEKTRVYALESTGIIRKFSGVFDVMITANAPHACFCGWREVLAVRAAMQAHDSQYVWFRRLFILFSRYTYMNNLVLQSPPQSAQDKKRLQQIRDTKSKDK